MTATAGHSNAASKARLRLWLRLLKVQRRIETELRERLRAQFATTLPRFDVMAALWRFGDGLKMSDLSAVLRVSNGNVTGIVDRLAGEGLVERLPVEGDRRVSLVRLTESGRREFSVQARAHECWIDEMLAGFPPDLADSYAAGLKALSERDGERDS